MRRNWSPSPWHDPGWRLKLFRNFGDRRPETNETRWDLKQSARSPIRGSFSVRDSSTVINSGILIEPADTSRTIAVRHLPEITYVLFASNITLVTSRNGHGKRTTPALCARLLFSRHCVTHVREALVENWLTLGDNYRSDGTGALLRIDFAATSHLWYHIPRYAVCSRFASVAPVKWSRQ